MATYNFNVTDEVKYIRTDISASQVTTFDITQSGNYTSYFILESPSNTTSTSGSYTLSSGISKVSEDFHSAFIIPQGGGTIEFTPATYISASTLRMRGVGITENQDGILAYYGFNNYTEYYTGPVFRLSRSLDDAELDIYTTQNGTIDSTAISDFCTGTTCSLVTWYSSDLSENYAIAQTNGVTITPGDNFFSYPSGYNEQDLKYPITLDGEFSINIWHQTDAVGRDTLIGGQGAAASYIQPRDGARYKVEFGNSATVGISDVSYFVNYTSGSWYLATLTRDTGGNVSFYLNGSQVTVDPPQVTQLPFYFESIGSVNDTWNPLFVGKIAEIEIKSRVMGAGEVLDKFNNEKGNYGL